jgi:hypothetical protein
LNIVHNYKQFNFQNLFDKVPQEKIILTYNGNITSEIVTNLLNILETKLEQLEVRMKSAKVIYNVLIEVLQNLYHHSSHNIADKTSNKDNKWAVFILYMNNDYFTLSTGNYVEKKDIGILKNRIEYINSLTKEEIKEYYIKVLNNAQYSEKGGGGLGLIDIAKKTGSKLEYNFYDFNDEYSFYNLNINIL